MVNLKSKRVNIITLITISLTSFLIGYCAHSIEFSNVTFSQLKTGVSQALLKSISGVKITDIISALSASLTLAFAFTAYKNWLSTKIKEDSYSYAKNYISKCTQINSIVRSIENQYNQLHLKAGMLPISESECAKKIDFISTLSNNLYQASLDLTDAKNELQFWVVSLTSPFEEKHDILIDHIHQLLTVMLGYSSQLQAFHILKKKNHDILNSEREFFYKHLSVINNTLTSRHGIKFNEMFVIK